MCLCKVISYHQHNYFCYRHFYLLSSSLTQLPPLILVQLPHVILSSTSEVCISYTLSLPTTGKYVFRDLVQRIYTAYFTFEISYVLWYTHNRNFLYAYKKNTGFLVPIFTKLTNTTTLCVYTSSRISPKLDNKHGRYMYIVNHALK